MTTSMQSSPTDGVRTRMRSPTKICFHWSMYPTRKASLRSKAFAIWHLREIVATIGSTHVASTKQTKRSYQQHVPVL
jgi:hypothetical protein